MGVLGGGGGGGGFVGGVVARGDGAERRCAGWGIARGGGCWARLGLAGCVKSKFDARGDRGGALASVLGDGSARARSGGAGSVAGRGERGGGGGLGGSGLPARAAVLFVVGGNQAGGVDDPFLQRRVCVAVGGVQ